VCSTRSDGRAEGDLSQGYFKLPSGGEISSGVRVSIWERITQKGRHNLDMDYHEAFKTIARDLSRGELTLLFGAGMSVDSNVPGGRKMAVQMLRRIALGDEKDTSRPDLDSLAGKYPFEAISDLLQEKKVDFSQWLKQEGGLGKALVSPAHTLLREVHEYVPNQFPRVVFTTNFDTLLEEGLGWDRAECVTSENFPSLSDAKRSKKVAVVHLHGCTNHPQSVVVGEISQATLRNSVFELFRGSLATETMVMVGYSMEDTNLRDIFYHIQSAAQKRRGMAKRTFAVSPADGDGGDILSAAGLAQKVWDRRGVDHLPFSAEKFFSELFKYLTDYLEHDLMGRVAFKMGINEGVLGNMLESATKPFSVLEPVDLLIYLDYALPAAEN